MPSRSGTHARAAVIGTETDVAIEPTHRRGGAQREQCCRRGQHRAQPEQRRRLLVCDFAALDRRGEETGVFELGKHANRGERYGGKSKVVRPQ